MSISYLHTMVRVTDVAEILRFYCEGLGLEEVRGPALGPGQRGTDELAEQRVRVGRTALELGMGLGADPEGMAVQLDELDEPVVR